MGKGACCGDNCAAADAMPHIASCLAMKEGHYEEHLSIGTAFTL